MHHLQVAELEVGEDQDFDTAFAKDVFHGLTHEPKWLSSKYFYDSAGDKIFQQIMSMDSYYLTRSETEIFETHKDDILRDIYHHRPLDLIELGAGDGEKTKILLKHFYRSGTDFSFAPCDISSNAIKMLEENVRKEVPDIEIDPLIGDYFEVLSGKTLTSDKRKSVILFLGSNIGNYTADHGKDFLKRLRDNMKPNDILIIGFDLKKDPNIVLRAYNDPEGITASFNMNLLKRINHELGGEFEVDSFQHHPVYDPVSGECRSYLLSKKRQKVAIRKLDLIVEFDSWEPIFTEISKKFTHMEMENVASKCGFEPVTSYADKKNFFMDAIWKAI